MRVCVCIASHLDRFRHLTLAAALESVARQTRRPDAVVLRSSGQPPDLERCRAILSGSAMPTGSVVRRISDADAADTEADDKVGADTDTDTDADADADADTDADADAGVEAGVESKAIMLDAAHVSEKRSQFEHYRSMLEPSATGPPAIAADDIIIFLDDDDLLARDKIATVLEYFEQGADIVEHRIDHFCTREVSARACLSRPKHRCNEPKFFEYCRFVIRGRLLAEFFAELARLNFDIRNGATDCLLSLWLKKFEGVRIPAVLLYVRVSLIPRHHWAA